MSLSLALQSRVSELLASKRMSSSERADARRRYVEAWSVGAVRVLIRELEAYEDMSADEVEGRWQEIEESYEEISNVIGKE